MRISVSVFITVQPRKSEYYLTLYEPGTDTEMQLLTIFSTTLPQAVLQRSSITTLQAFCTRHMSSSAPLARMAASFKAGREMRLHRNKKLKRFEMPNLPANFLRLFQLREHPTMVQLLIGNSHRRGRRSYRK
jgi:hypothetical protein